MKRWRIIYICHVRRKGERGERGAKRGIYRIVDLSSRTIQSTVVHIQAILYTIY